MIATGYTALSKTHGVVIERSRLVFTLQGLTEGHTRALVSCGGSRDMNSYSPDYLCAPSLCVFYFGLRKRMVLKLEVLAQR